MDSRLKLILNGDPEEVLMLLVRLKNPGVLVPFCQVITQFGDVVTCRVKRKNLLELYNSPDIFSVKAPRLIPSPLQKEEIETVSSESIDGPSRRFKIPYTGKGIYFAAVDWGFDIAHSNLRKPDGSTRFKCIWDQNGDFDGNRYGYGCIYSGEKINQSLQTDTPYQTLGYHPGRTDVLGMGMHGTHVVDIATGTPAVGEGGVAPEATIIGVELGNNFVNGSDLALGDSVRLIEALHFINEETKDAPCVINMSLGSHGDSHTGKSLVEIALDNFLNQNTGYALVQSVGNYYSSDCHIQHTIEQGETYNLEWYIPKRNPLPGEVEIWYPGPDRFSVRLFAPNGEIAADVQPFEDIQISWQNTAVGYIFHRSLEPNTGLNHIDIILDAPVLKGKWIIEITGTDVSNGSFDAYSERNDASQAKFSHQQSSPYTTTGSVCNGRQTITAGAYNHRDTLKPVVRFSSSGPTIFGQPKPDLLAPGYKILAARSAPSIATGAINQLIAKSGSSMAAPHVSGCVVLLFQKYLPERLGVTKTRQLLFDLLDPLPACFLQQDQIRGGRGFLNINKIVATQKKITMDTTYYTRPVRRLQPELQMETFSAEQEYHAPYFHQNCQLCNEALLETIDEGSWANEPDLLHKLSEAYFNADDAAPFTLYRHFHPRYHFHHQPFQQSFAPVALSGKRLIDDIETGDIILLRNILSGKTYQAIITDPELLINEPLNNAYSNSQKPGSYIKAYGNLPGNENQIQYIRIADRNNRVLDNIMIIKKLLSSEGVTEPESSFDNSFQSNESVINNEGSEDGHDDVKGRTKWFLSTRIPKDKSTGKTPPYYSIASAKVREMRHESNNLLAMESTDIIESPPGGLGTNNWTPLGPSVIANGQASGNPPVSGRITSIAVNNQNRIYAASANGGVWYSPNGGENWEPNHGFIVSPTQTAGADSLAVGAIAVKFGSSKTKDEVYAGTGEANGSDSYFGIGIWHSLNGVWSLEATNLAGEGIYKIVVDPSDSSRVFAATTVGLYQRNVVTAGGKKKVQWKLVTVAPSATGWVTDFIIAGTGADKKHYAAFQNDKIYSGNHDITIWTSIQGTPSGLRTALAAGNNNPDVVYAFNEKNILYRLSNPAISPLKFIKVSGTIPPVFNGANGGQGDYDIILGVDPDHDDKIYIAGDYISVPGTYDLSLYTGSVGGTEPNFIFTGKIMLGTKIHPDGHAIAFSKYGGKVHAWVGCDGGLFHSDTISTDGSYKPRNTGISSAQINYIAHREDTDTVLLAGLQDNGTVRYLGDQVWNELPQGDGGGVAIDPDPLKPYNFMSQYIRSTLSKSTDGGITWKRNILPSITQSEENNSPFYAPIETFYHGGKTLVAFGTDRLWLSDDWGSHWKSLPNNNVADRFTTIIAIKIAAATTLFAATRTGIFRYDFSGTWHKTALVHPGDLPVNANITAIDIDNPTTGSFYIALGGAGNFERCFYYDGTNWHKAGPSAATLNIPCHAIIADPNAPHDIYLGSDVGVWKGERHGNAWTLTWTLYSQGLPEAAITDLQIHSAARLLRAATHGRGVWEIALDTSTGNATDIYLRANYADSGRMHAGKRFPWIKTAEDPSRVPSSAARHTVNLTMSPDIKVRRASLGAITSGVNYYDFGYNIGEQVKNPNWQRGDLTGTNQVFIQVHNRGLHIISGSNISLLLLMADVSSGSSPDLPAGFITNINAANKDPRWLSGSNWQFADAANPYKILAANLNVRTPQVARFNVKFSDIHGLTGSSKVALLAFITTVDSTDKITSTITKIDDLIMADKQVAQRYVVFA